MVLERPHLSIVREKTEGGQGRKSYKPATTAALVFCIKQSTCNTLRSSEASKQNATLNCLILYISRNTEARFGDRQQRISSQKNTTTISENTGDVMVERRILVVQTCSDVGPIEGM